MTERERILSILRGEKPDRLPWCADFAYYADGLRQDKLYPAQYVNTYYDNGLQKMHRDYGAGFYLQGHFPYTSKIIGDDISVSTEVVGEQSIKTIKTPIGNLREIQQYSPASYSTGIVEHLIKDINDLRNFCYVCEHTQYSPNYEFAQKQYETIGDNGVVLCYMPKSPMMELVAIQSGIENFTYMALDDEDELQELLDRLEVKCDEACELVLNSPAECIMIPENISSECVTPFYHKYMERYHKKWTKKIHDREKFSFVHLDGTVRGLVGELSRSGFDVVEAITPKPVGDVDIEEVCEIVLDKTIIWGGIPGGFFTPSISDEEFDSHIIKCIKAMTKSPRHVLGVADQVVPGATIERIKRVRELVDLFGNYL